MDSSRPNERVLQFILELVQGDDELDSTAIEEQLIAIQLLTTQDTPEEVHVGDGFIR